MLTYLLVPFWLCLAIFSHLVDIIIFIGQRLNDFFTDLYYQLTVAIDLLPLSLKAKYYLMAGVGWAPTVILSGLVIWMVGSWARDSLDNYTRAYNEIVITSEADSGQKTATYLVPEEIKIATDEALVRRDEEELAESWRQASQLTPEQIEQLSQRAKINLALLYYYRGDEAAYQRFLQEARQMDPNDRLFRR